MTDHSLQDSAQAIFDDDLRKQHIEKLSKNKAYNLFYDIGADALLEASFRSLFPPNNLLLYGCFGNAMGHFLEMSPNITQGNVVAAYHSKNVQKIFVSPESAMPINQAQFDLALSNMSLQFVNDIPGALRQYHGALRKDGLFIATIVGNNSFYELREAFAHADQKLYNGIYPRVMPMVDSNSILHIMRAVGLRDVVAHTHIFTLYGSDIIAMLHSLKIYGFSNFLRIARKSPLSKTVLKIAEKYFFSSQYCDKKATGKKIRLTYNMIIVSGFK